MAKPWRLLMWLFDELCLRLFKRDVVVLVPSTFLPVAMVPAKAITATLMDTPIRFIVLPLVLLTELDFILITPKSAPLNWLLHTAVEAGMLL
jgi:hypothetical protein